MTKNVIVKDDIWRSIFDRVRALGSNPRVKVGIVGPDASARAEASNLSLVELAAVHEFGSPNAHVPQRSFIRSTFVRVRGEVVKQTKAIARGLLDGSLTVDQALGVLGAWGAGQVRRTIVEQRTTSDHFEQQANRPETVKRKGSSTPLVDTGQLVNAVTWAIADEDE